MRSRVAWGLWLAGLATSVLAASGSAFAAEDGFVGVKSRAELEQLDVLLRAGAVPPEVSRQLFKREGAAYAIDTSYFANRVQTPQLHVQYDEVLVVLSGAATLRLGGELIDGKPHQGDPNEIRSPNMKGGITRTIATGDVVSVPRGTVHQVNPGVGHIHYMVIKIQGK